MPIRSVETGLFEGLTLSELLARSLDKLHQKEGNYDRYDKELLKRALNDGNSDAVVLTHCIKGFGIIEMKEGYSQYKPPSDMLLFDKFFFYQSATSYWELKQKSRHWLDTHKRGWRVQSGDPLYMYPGDSYGSLRKIGFTPTPDTDGDSYIADPDTGIYTSATGMTTSGNITGTNNAASATICTDSAGRTMSDLGVTVGLTAVNVTDGSKGQINAVAGATFTVTSLTGGTANTWAVGDSFNVLAGEYGIVTDWTNDEKFIFAAEVGGITDVSTIVNNVYIEYVRRPLILEFDTQYPNIPPELHQYLPEYVNYYCNRKAPRKSSSYEEAMASLQIFREGIQRSYVDFDSLVEDDGIGDCYIS